MSNKTMDVRSEGSWESIYNAINVSWNERQRSRLYKHPAQWHNAVDLIQHQPGPAGWLRVGSNGPCSFPVKMLQKWPWGLATRMAMGREYIYLILMIIWRGLTPGGCLSGSAY